MRIAFRILPALLLLGLLVSTAPVIGAPTVIEAQSTDDGFRFAPDSQHVVKGKVVKWKNTTSVTHRVKFYKGKLKGKLLTIPAGESKKLKMKKVGKQKYRCTIGTHSNLEDGVCSGMCGVVHVMS